MTGEIEQLDEPFVGRGGHVENLRVTRDARASPTEGGCVRLVP
jgi:hypothetical protein